MINKYQKLVARGIFRILYENDTADRHWRALCHPDHSISISSGGINLSLPLPKIGVGTVNAFYCIFLLAVKAAFLWCYLFIILVLY